MQINSIKRNRRSKWDAVVAAFGRRGGEYLCEDKKDVWSLSKAIEKKKFRVIVRGLTVYAVKKS